MISDLKRTLKVPLKFHWTALILPALLIINSGWIGIFYWVLLMAALLLHEYSHVFIALKRGVKVNGVLLYVFGGTAMFEAKLCKPKDEAIISIAGPLSSLLLAIFMFPFAMLTWNDYVGLFVAINLMVGMFNLIPAYPTDGGRILFAILSHKLNPKKAIKISFVVSCVVASIGITFAILNSLIWLGLISGFVVFLAYNQKKIVEKLIAQQEYLNGGVL